MATLFQGQDYHALKRELQTRKKLFTDPTFPPNASSLLHSGTVSNNIVWRRPGEICDDPRLVVDGLAPSDLNQGELGNCWFVAACSALALEKKLWDRVVPNVREQEWNPDDPKQYCGIFHFHFWHFGEWVDVVVDDWLPTKNGHLVFIKSNDKNEFWSALLEKAYAKLAGSYKALSGGRTGDALVDFTGGVNEFVELRTLFGHARDEVDSPKPEEEEKRRTVFKSLLDAHERQAMISCSIPLKERDRPETEMECGLIKGHAYTVVDIREMKLSFTLMSLFGNKEKLMMIKMRNPWGRKEWNGAWSDSSDEWRRVPKKEKEEMKLKVADDGEFWMEFHDWCQYFTHASICHNVNINDLTIRGTWHEREFQGRWEGALAGGVVDKDAILHNPQYAFTVEEEQKVMISLMQKSIRGGTTSQNENYVIGFIVMKVEENRKYRLYTQHKWVEQVKFFNLRSISGRFMFDIGRYVIIPATHQPGLERDFVLRIFSEHKIRPFELFDVPLSKYTCPECGGDTSPPVGVVTVQVISVSGLNDRGNLETGPNVYCKVHCMGTTVLTPVRANTLEPNFKTSAIFYAQKPAKTCIEIEVMNRTVSADHLLGEVATNIPDVSEGELEYCLKLLQYNSETEGFVRFKVRHYADVRAI